MQANAQSITQKPATSLHYVAAESILQSGCAREGIRCSTGSRATPCLRAGIKRSDGCGSRILTWRALCQDYAEKSRRYLRVVTSLALIVSALVLFAGLLQGSPVSPPGILPADLSPIGGATPID